MFVEKLKRFLRRGSWIFIFERKSLCSKKNLMVFIQRQISFKNFARSKDLLFLEEIPTCERKFFFKHIFLKKLDFLDFLKQKRENIFLKAF